MKISLILTAVLFISTVTANAQNSKVVAAWNYLTEFQRDGSEEAILKAREAINEATTHEKTMANAKTWNYKGMIELAILGSEAHQDLAPEAMKAATEAFEKSIELDTKKRFKDDNVQNLRFLINSIYTSGSDFYNAKDYKSAYGEFSQILEIRDLIDANTKKAEPMDTASLQAGAICAQNAGLDDEAMTLYQKMYDANIKEDYVLKGLSGLNKKAGNDAKAKALREEARALYPDNQGLLIDEINEMLTAGENEAAMNLLEEAIANEPDKAELHFALGSAKDTQKDYEGARAAYEKAVELNPDYFDAYYNLGAIYYNQAAEITKKMNELGLDEQDAYDKYQVESVELFKTALPFFEKGHNINKTDRNTLIALKEIYAKTGDFENSNAMKALLETE